MPTLLQSILRPGSIWAWPAIGQPSQTKKKISNPFRLMSVRLLDALNVSINARAGQCSRGISCG
jgi:hypothetical protein